MKSIDDFFNRGSYRLSQLLSSPQDHDSKYESFSTDNNVQIIRDEMERVRVIVNDIVGNKKKKKLSTFGDYTNTTSTIESTPCIPSAFKKLFKSLIDDEDSMITTDKKNEFIKYVYNVYNDALASNSISEHNKMIRKLEYTAIPLTDEEKKAKKSPTHMIAFAGDSNENSVQGIELMPTQLDLLIKYNEYCDKIIAKREAKTAMPKHFKVGDVIAIRGKIRDGSRRNIKKFEVKKLIWSINSKAVNIYILKQLSGEYNNMTLTKNDCKKYHVKYEENLQAYSMMMNWYFIEKIKK